MVIQHNAKGLMLKALKKVRNMDKLKNGHLVKWAGEACSNMLKAARAKRWDLVAEYANVILKAFGG